MTNTPRALEAGGTEMLLEAGLTPNIPTEVKGMDPAIVEAFGHFNVLGRSIV